MHISLRVKDVCDILITNGYLDIAPGSHNRQNPGAGNRNSRIKPTAKLEGLFKNVGLETFELSLNHNRECIILRDKDPEDNKAKDIEYKDTPQTNKMRAEVQAYNQMMLGHYVDVASYSREAASDLSLVASDGLHPSGKMYTGWVLLALPKAIAALENK